MKRSVSISEFRENLSMYLRLARYKGESVTIVDEKIDETVGMLVPPKKETDWDEYMKFVESMHGAWKDLPTDKNREALRKTDIKTINSRLKK